MSESTYDDSNLVIVQNPKNNSLFSSSIKKIIIIAKKNKNYFFPKIPHFTKDEKIKEGLILFLAIISYFLYYLSLGGCDGTQTECLKNSNIAYYYMLVNYCFTELFYCYSIIIFCAKIWQLFLTSKQKQEKIIEKQ